VDYLLFNLLVLGSITDREGYVWSRSPTDLYVIETMPLMQRDNSRMAVCCGFIYWIVTFVIWSLKNWHIITVSWRTLVVNVILIIILLIISSLTPKQHSVHLITSWLRIDGNGSRIIPLNSPGGSTLQYSPVWEFFYLVWLVFEFMTFSSTNKAAVKSVK